MARKSYYEQLKDPRWQRKRLEILQRAEFACEECGDGTQTLHVHHTIYRKGAAPWEYDNAELRCLCENCHAEMHARRSVLDEIVSVIARRSLVELNHLIGYAACLAAADCGDGIAKARVSIAHEGESYGVSHYFNVDFLNVEEWPEDTIPLRKLWEIRQRELQGEVHPSRLDRPA